MLLLLVPLQGYTYLRQFAEPRLMVRHSMTWHVLHAWVQSKAAPQWRCQPTLCMSHDSCWHAICKPPQAGA